MILITAMWLIIFLGSFIIFQFIVPMPDMSTSLEGRVMTSIVKVTISGFLVFSWLYIMWILRNYLVVHRILLKPQEE
jgi:hypothetical protein